VLFVNTFHVVSRRAVALSDDVTADAVRDALNTALTTKYRALMPTTFSVDLFDVREEVDPAGGAIPSESSLTIAAAGTRAVGTFGEPLGLSQVVSFKTNAAIRSGHGRMWIPIVDKDVLNTSGQLITTGALATATTAFFDELKSNHGVTIVADSWTLSQVVYSRTRRARGDANYYFDVTAYIRRLTPHWLRSRMTAP
jgi:hypothetical protein